jgi:crotonobetainyl-CoA:carnitine CoA-transferase CaiB-like acyl-CoA transferase
LLAEIGRRLQPYGAAELAQRFEAAGLPFAPIMKPEQLLDDPHLLATGGLADIVLTDGERAGRTVKTTLFPFTLDGERPGVRLNPPRRGEHTREVLRAIGLADAEIDALIECRAVA